jgi:hypothetical protein
MSKPQSPAEKPGSFFAWNALTGSKIHISSQREDTCAALGRPDTRHVDVSWAGASLHGTDCDAKYADEARREQILATILIFCPQVRRIPFQMTCRRYKVVKV